MKPILQALKTSPRAGVAFVALVAGLSVGLYEFAPNPVAVLAAALQGDINEDGRVDVVDLSILLSNYGKTAPTPSPSASPSPAPSPSPSSPPVSCTKTLAAGGNIQAFIDTLSAGQTGCLRTGSYVPTNQYLLVRGSYVLASYPGERATIRGGVHVMPSANGFKMRRVAVNGDTQPVTTFWIEASNVTIEDSDITNNNVAANGTEGSCLYVDNNPQNVVVQRNKIHNCGKVQFSHGIYMGTVTGMEVRDNVIWGVGAYGIQVYPNAQNNRIHHNVVDGAPRSSVIVGSDGGTTSRGNIIENNILSNAAEFSIHTYWGAAVGSGNIGRNNCINKPAESGGGIAYSGNVTVSNPSFVNRSAANFGLASGSPCAAVVGYDIAAKLTF